MKKNVIVLALMVASWYGPGFHGKRTSTGEIFNQYALTAAHKTLPPNTIVKITNPLNNKTVNVRINDSGPYVKGRDIDLSMMAAKRIGLTKKGVQRVKIEVLRKGGPKSTKRWKVRPIARY